jgi:HEAT repeat protein
MFAEAEPAVPALVNALWDEESHVRSSAAEALGRIGPGAKKAVPALVALLQGEAAEDHVCSATAEALGLIGPAAEPAVPVLREKLRHGDVYVGVSAALALWRIGKDRSGAALVVAAAEDRNIRARICAAEARWHMQGEPAAVASLLEVLQENSLNDEPGVSNLRYMVARALGRIGPPAKAAAPALREMLDDEDQYLGTTAAAALKQIVPE